MGWASWIREHQVEHFLPSFHCPGRRGAGIGPHIGWHKSGTLFAVPNPWVNVGACGVAEVGQRGAAQMEPNLVDVASGLQTPVRVDQSIHQENIALALGRNHGHGAAQS